VNLDRVEKDFRTKVSEQIRLASEGLARFRVFTPFMFEDGDHLAVVLKKDGSRWILSDEGHTFMHLTYELEEKDLRQGTRERIIGNALSVFGIEDREGELTLPVQGSQYGDALYSFVQGLMKVTDVTFLSRERAKSTFMEDFRGLVERTIPEPRRTFGWNDPKLDPDANYAVDCRVNGMAVPLFVFAIPNDDRAQYATIALLQYEKWRIAHKSVSIFADQAEINRRVLARLTDVCERQFSSLAVADRIEAFLGEALSVHS
jgi:hypothetical protein